MLAVEGLTIRHRGVSLVRNLGFALAAAETLGIVGESGSGKSLTALALMGLLPGNMQASGSIGFEGQNLLALAEPELCALRGAELGMVFQEPMTALNPVHRIGRQIMETLLLHRHMPVEAARAEAIRLLGRVGLSDPERRLRAYPHELSGGQRQRVLIAMAIACRPKLLIADEPTSALDVTVQAQILDLLADLKAETGMAILFISHDLGVVGRIADRILVLYGGSMMEEGPTAEVLRAPRHPYTRGLISALPDGVARGQPLRPIAGQVPPPALRAPGCPFFGRCPIGDATCRDVPPPVQEGATRALCHHLKG